MYSIAGVIVTKGVDAGAHVTCILKIFILEEKGEYESA